MSRIAPEGPGFRPLLRIQLVELILAFRLAPQMIDCDDIEKLMDALAIQIGRAADRLRVIGGGRAVHA
jgi:hypothetical protein